MTATPSHPFSPLPPLLNRQILSDNRFVKSWESSFLSNESELNHWKTSLVRTRRAANNEWLYFTQGSSFCSFSLKEERESPMHSMPLLSHFPKIQGHSPAGRRSLGQDETAVHRVCGSLHPALSHSLHSCPRLETSCLTYLLIPWVHPYLIYPLCHWPQPCMCLQLPVYDSLHKPNCLNRSAFFFF